MFIALDASGRCNVTSRISLIAPFDLDGLETQFALVAPCSQDFRRMALCWPSAGAAVRARGRVPSKASGTPTRSISSLRRSRTIMSRARRLRVLRNLIGSQQRRVRRRRPRRESRPSASAVWRRTAAAICGISRSRLTTLAALVAKSGSSRRRRRAQRRAQLAEQIVVTGGDHQPAIRTSQTPDRARFPAVPEP